MRSIKQNVRATVKLWQVTVRHMAGKLNVRHARLSNQFTQAPFLAASPRNFERCFRKPLLYLSEGPHYRIDAIHFLQVAGYQEFGLELAPLTITERLEVYDVGDNFDRHSKA